MSPTLFPFLAVLICTMGTLLLLLLLVTRKTEAAAHQEAVAEIESQQQFEREDEDWRRDEFLKVRQQATDLLEVRRSELAHLEDHLRRLDEELRILSEKIVAADSSPEVDVFQKEVDKLKSQAATLQATVAENIKNRDELEKRPPKVSIIPHRGPNGTQRRPIYIECVGEEVIIQPEGIRLPIAVLRGPLGPGNPLDSALRVIRLHWQGTDPEPPYPLIVVRPNGIIAFAVARASMSAWDDQYGYELIPQNMQLAYQPPDPVLADRIRRTVLEAVQRRESLIAAMPGRYQSNQLDPLDRAMREASDAADRTMGQAGSFDPLTGWRQASTDSSFDSSSRNLLQDGTTLREPAALADVGIKNASADSVSAPGSRGTSGSARALGSNGKIDLTSKSGSSRPAGSASASDASGTTDLASASGSSQNGSAGQAGSAGQTDSASASGGVHADPSQQSGAASPFKDLGSKPPIAAKRGRGWALPEDARTSGPAVVRRLSVRCAHNYFELATVDGRWQRFSASADQPERSVMDLAKAVRERIESWGPALAGGRWVPTLVADVGFDGADSFAALEQQLQGSGILVERRTFR
jgi:hypothetical protein